jgi:hypothetical protein
LSEAQSKKLHSLEKPIAEYDQGPVWEPDADLLNAHHELFDRAHAGERWELEVSANSRMPVVVQKPVVARSGCLVFAGFLAEVAPARQVEFAASEKQYFLIHQTSGISSQAIGRNSANIGPLPDWKETPELRSQIEQFLKERMKNELPGVHAESVREYQRADEISEALAERWKRFDQKLALGEGKLDYDTQAFQLSPDGIPRLFVRARWTIDQKPAFLMSLWLRAGSTLAVEAVDAGEARVMRMSEFFDIELGLPELGTVVNVFDRKGDGHGELLIYRSGYEGYDIHLFRYTDAGPVPTEISHGGGC